MVGSTHIHEKISNFAADFKKGDIYMELPNDPMMLFSMVNMKLRDCYGSLDELCEDMNVDKELLIKKLQAAGFEYSKENNKFW